MVSVLPHLHSFVTIFPRRPVHSRLALKALSSHHSLWARRTLRTLEKIEINATYEMHSSTINQLINQPINQ